jgi:hypothetical protein
MCKCLYKYRVLIEDSELQLEKKEEIILLMTPLIEALRNTHEIAFEKVNE